MKRLALILTVTLGCSLPFVSKAQTQDTTQHPGQDTSAQPGSNWKNYHEQPGYHHYNTGDRRYTSDFRPHYLVGGGLSLGYSYGEFLGAINPYFGYAPVEWFDAGVAVNFQYYSENEQATLGTGTYHNTMIGGGVFARAYPISFLFLQAQPEYNTIRETQSSYAGGDYSSSYGVFSFLVGGGVKFGMPGSGSFGYVSVLFDVANNPLSPYNFGTNNIQPIFRFGFNVAL
jgi:hypothetical protein